MCTAHETEYVPEHADLHTKPCEMCWNLSQVEVDVVSLRVSDDKDSTMKCARMIPLSRQREAVEGSVLALAQRKSAQLQHVCVCATQQIYIGAGGCPEGRRRRSCRTHFSHPEFHELHRAD